ncbi:PH domain-containing protein [Vallitalea pronyensis]|uniref:PH domain-containing protein n=1 Tax=Vallitalea pronyensis TaxID=1348613 RepID=A0A8J8SGX8_9FIRM|nr:PH domain-containing protein [Vallitalea pronyensis]QUI22859.1 PH domain-containing protein [Vallitalea pronyensis]
MEYNHINRQAVKSWIIARTIFLVVFNAVYFVGVYGFLKPIIHNANVMYFINGLTGIMVVYILAYTFVFPIIEYKEWRYKIHEDKIEFIHGIFVRKKVIIPISRIQFLDIICGPINRKFGLSSIKLNTAGGLHVIPALTNQEAEGISVKLTKIIETSETHA